LTMAVIVKALLRRKHFDDRPDAAGEHWVTDQTASHSRPSHGPRSGGQVRSFFLRNGMGIWIYVDIIHSYAWHRASGRGIGNRQWTPWPAARWQTKRRRTGPTSAQRTWRAQ
jgi:hypothetical protein